MDKNGGSIIGLEAIPNNLKAMIGINSSKKLTTYCQLWYYMSKILNFMRKFKHV